MGWPNDETCAIPGIGRQTGCSKPRHIALSAKNRGRDRVDWSCVGGILAWHLLVLFDFFRSWPVLARMLQVGISTYILTLRDLARFVEKIGFAINGDSR